MSSRFVSLTGVAIFLISFQSVPAFAQVDLSGQWAAINQSDAKTRGPGPDLMDQTAIPLNEEGRAVAASYSSVSYTHLTLPTILRV